MPAFHTIAVPHEDILQGRLALDVFGADLWEVFKGRGVEEYRNSELFFQKTYQTRGLKYLLDSVKKRLDGGGGDSVLQIQTPFGGGKTHSLIALYHKAAEWGAKRVVIVGTPMGPKDTLWGILEEQLTGKRKDFRDFAAPGRTDAFRAMVAAAGPTLILIDELLEYVTKASAVPVQDSTLAKQTIAFMQELTEMVGTLDNVVLVITLPSSAMPNMDANAQNLMQQLQLVAGRKEHVHAPVEDDEITKVIRSRLFSRIDAKKVGTAVGQFVDYASHEAILPAGTEASEYRARFQDSYPFLPEVIDVLYHRWGSYPTFQRTRGVLRLLALVIFALKDANIPYISLADFNLDSLEIRRELLKHIPSNFDTIVAADITDTDAGAHKVNADLGRANQGLRLGERVATTIFMHSFSGGTERGVTMVEIKRNATTLENPSALVAEAVEDLKGRLFYLQNQAGKYFFTNEANLNHLLLVRMENIHDPEVHELEERLLKENVRSERFKSYIWRTESSDVPDTQDLKLVVLPDNNPATIKSMQEEKGGTPRVHRNTVFFLVPLFSERLAFSNLIRRYLAYEALQQDPTVTLTPEQSKTIKESVKKLEPDLLEGLRRLYRQVLIPARSGTKECDLGVPTSGYSGYMDQEIYDRLRLDGEVLERVAPLVIKEKYLRDRDWVSTAQLYQSSLKTPGEARAVNLNAWETGIAEGVRQGLFGIGDLKNEEPICRLFKQEGTPTFVDNEVLIKDEVCQAQLAKNQGQTTFIPGDLSKSNTYETSGGFIPDTPTPVPFASKYQQLDFNFTVPKGKVSNLMGVLNYLQSKYEHMVLNLHLDRGQLTEQEYEDKVREAFRQMGIDINKPE